MPISETKDILLDKLRFILGAPPGVCAALIRLKPGSSKVCEECPNPITEADGEVWFCDAGLLRKRRKSGLCYWHHDCLKLAPLLEKGSDASEDTKALKTLKNRKEVRPGSAQTES